MKNKKKLFSAKLKKKYYFYFLLFLVLNCCSITSKSLLAKNYLNYDKNIFKVIGTNKINKDKVFILIEKSKYKLTVYYEDNPVKEYPVVFGKNPIDDKLKEGDGCTPEGKFKIKAMFVHKKWSKFLWINYPTKESWEKFNQAKKVGKLKPNDTIGGEVGIHGVPKEMDKLIDEKINWTIGCISLKNKDVNELYEIVKVGTDVEILP